MKRVIHTVALVVAVAWPGAVLAQQPGAADSAWVAGDIDGAFRLYEARLVLDSTDVTALHRVALVMAWTERYSESLSLLERATMLAPNNLEVAVDYARVTGWSGRHEQALHLVDRVLAASPDHPAGLELRAQILSWSGNYEAHLAAADRLERVDPERAKRLRLPRAQALAATGRQEEAFAEILSLLGEAPDSTEALRMLETLAADAIRTNRQQLALSAYTQLAGQSNRPAPYLMARARILANTGDYGAAAVELDRLLALDSLHFEALEATAQYSSWSRRYANALAAYDRLIAARPDTIRYQLQRARVLSWAERYGESIDAYEHILARDPALVDARIGLAQVLSWTRQFDAARSLYETVLASDPDQPLATRGLAQVASWSGDLKTARERWLAAIEKDPADVNALVGLASTLGSEGRHREALRLLMRADSLEPNHPDVSAARTLSARALAPALIPAIRHVSDSDGNAINSFTLDAAIPIRGTVVLRGSATRSGLDQDGQTSLDDHVITAQVGADALLDHGWRVAGRLGLWQADQGMDRSRGTGSLEIASPPWSRARGRLRFHQAPYDVTALVVRNRVQLRELAADGAIVIHPRATVELFTSVASFRASEQNTRLLSSARLHHRIGSAVTAGPAVRWFTFSKQVSDGYWNPDDYTLVELPVTWTVQRAALQPSLEVAVGYQRISQTSSDRSWSVAMRAQAGVTYRLGVLRHIGVHVALANSGLQQLSPLSAGTYRYRGITLSGNWAF